MEENYSDKEIIQFTKDAFANYSLNAEEKVWSNIQSELQKDKKKVIGWWQYGMAAGVLMVVGLGFWFFNSNSPTKNIQYQPQKMNAAIINSAEENEGITSKEEKPEIENSLVNTDKKIVSDENVNKQSFVQELAKAQVGYTNKNASSRNENKALVNIIKEDDYKDNIELKTTSAGNIAINKIDSIQEKSETNLAQNKSNTKIAKLNDTSSMSIATKAPHEITAADIDKGMPIEEEIESNKNRSLYIAANLNSASSSSSSAGDELLALDMPNENNQTPFATATNDTKSREQAFGERTFDLPIQASVTLNYAFNRRWSIESGFAYSLLRAESESILSLENNLIRNEELHYLGIPLMLNYNIITKKKFNTFISLGAGIEKGISYRLKIEDKESGESFTNKDGVDGIKYTFNTGVGIEYRFIPLISFYLFPGATYYSSSEAQPFDIGGSKRSGVTPTLRLGLRFHLNNK